jgi:N-acetylmuramoyl-L-alanine amidase
MSKELKYLVIHTTDTPYDREITPEMIRQWHLSPVSKGGRGWKQVGYSDLIQRSGKLVNLVPYNKDNKVDQWEVTNGVAGMNSVCRHVVLAGGWSKDGKVKNGQHTVNGKSTYYKIDELYTEEQIKTLTEYVKNQLKLVPTLKVVGHNDLAAKTCPNFKVEEFLKEYVYK